MVHRILRITLVAFGLILLLFSQQFLTQPGKSSKDYIVLRLDQLDYAGKPKQKLSSNYRSGIKPDAKIMTEKFILPPEPPPSYQHPNSKVLVDKIDTSINLYRRRIELDFQGNQTTLNNYLLSISIDVLSLIRESKISFTCDQMYFKDSDGKTIISHWIEQGCGKETTKFWIRIPKIYPKSIKTIYFYYGNDTKYTYSNFKTTFMPEKNLVGWYYFLQPLQKKIPDFSATGNNGNLSEISYQDNWYFRETDSQKPYIFFSDWQSWFHGNSVYFSVPSVSMKSLAQSGSIELRLKLYFISEQIVQRFFVDSNQQLEIGFLYDGTLFFQNGKSSNKILWDFKLEQGEWYHFVCTWDLKKKSVNMYIDGKLIKQLPQHTPFNWKQSKPLGILEFGGYHTTDDDYGFAGLLDCLRIYNKPLNQKEVANFFQINKESFRYPDRTVLKEETVSSSTNDQIKIDFANIAKYPMTENVTINLLYASPYNLYFNYHSQEYMDTLKQFKEPPMVIDLSQNRDQPLFGFQSHFYSYIGTQISVKNKYLVNYVGLKINDPTLVDSFKINFAWMYDYHKKSIFENIGFFDFLFPPTFASGSGYSYQNLGDSEMEFYCLSNSICWYKLSKPIYINPTISVMQIEYAPSNKLGVLQIQLVDMLFMDQGKQLFRPRFYQKDTDDIPEKRSGPEKIVFPSLYKASILPMEKGLIDFRKNENNGLDMIFSNQGYDSITISEETINYIQDQLFGKIQVFTWDKKLLLEISIEDLKKHLLNQTIKSSHLIRFPILDSKSLPKNNTFYITYDFANSINGNEEIYPSKIISWVFGKDPYRYNYEDFNGSSLLYELWIANDSSFRFIEPKEE